jgi:hypothetical protein
MLKKNSFVKGKTGKSKSSVNYIDNQQFYEACLEHYNKVQDAKLEGKPLPRISNYIGECILKIAQKMTSSSHFRGYDFKEDMIGDAVENCLMYFNNFDPIKYKNPFSYFSQICYFAFLRRIGKERDRIYNQYKLSKDYRFVNNDAIHNIYDDETGQFIPTNFDDSVAMQTFVEKYETAAKKRKEKKA